MLVSQWITFLTGNIYSAFPLSSKLFNNRYRPFFSNSLFTSRLECPNFDLNWKGRDATVPWVKLDCPILCNLFIDDICVWSVKIAHCHLYIK